MRAMSMKPEIVVLDYLLGPADPNGASGLSVLKKINRMSPETFVIMLSSQDDIEAAVNTMKEGAFDYLAKNKTALLRLRNIIKKISESILYSRDMDYEMKRYKTLSIITISLIILLFFVSRLL
jgi:DNA-binding NtrC family response regulator